ncbi:cytochrome d ubiquinol oxidase subunit II, partial [candidate division KSB1 bacterium]|nr:cytochrome d ubiquinol oxidase subunit II [candidate division KSB1 bacterium]
WDISFSVSSIMSSLLIGVALGNLAWGIPLNENHEFIGSFWSLLNPYALVVGMTTVALFMMHGAIYIVLKTEGELQDKVRGWVNNTIIFFVLCYITTTMVTLVYVPHMTQHLKDYPILFGVAILTMLAVANIPREIIHRRDFRAFLSSCATIVGLLALFGIGVFPNLVYSNPLPEHSLQIYNAASSFRTLKIMLYVVIIGFPIVLSYTISIYWIFRGKVKLEAGSY